MALRVGIGGPVGSGKTRLIERILPIAHDAGLRVAVITNDLVTREDAERLQRGTLIASDLVVGVETGACPHTAIREDPSLNLAEVRRFEALEPGIDLIIIESGGDNLASSFSAELVDFWVFVLDCCGGDDVPRKRGLGVLQADLVVVTKMDLARYVDADVDRMGRDLAEVRGTKPWLITTLDAAGGAEVWEMIRRDLAL